jgi:uncharacterized SAM-binding protein YcdF (DUF218 family)
MSFVLSKILETMTQPGTLLLLLSVAGAALTLRRRGSRWGSRLLIAGIGGLAVCALLPVGTWMLRPLEDRFPSPEPLPERIDGIISLGGAIDLDASADRGAPVLNAAAGRMTAFVALAQRHPEARLVFTGGSGSLFPGKTNEAQVARIFFRDLGLDPRRFVFENASRNTRENAVLTRRIVTPKPGEHWLLVTTAADLPRAVGCFRAVGWQVIPVPADYHTLRNGSGFAPGLVGGVRDVNWAFHEWAGLVYYRLRGWTPSLFPGPDE